MSIASHDSQSSTSATLVQQLLRRDASAWQRLAELYSPLIRAWCRKLGLQAADADDVLQHVLTVVSQRLGEFANDGRSASFRRWLYTITLNHVRDLRRRQQHRPEPLGGTEAHLRFQEIPAPNAAGDVHAEASDLASTNDSLDQVLLLRRALQLIGSKVEERAMRAFVEVKIQKRAVADVAADLSLSPSAIYKAVFRIQKLLREKYPDSVPYER